MAAMKALVAFKSDATHPLSWMLKEGFQHCCVILKSEEHWIEFDMAKGLPLIRVKAPAYFNIQKFYEELGYTTLWTKQVYSPVNKFNILRGTFVIGNCVGMVKAILGINDIFFTPYSLYKKLKK